MAATGFVASIFVALELAVVLVELDDAAEADADAAEVDVEVDVAAALCEAFADELLSPEEAHPRTPETIKNSAKMTTIAVAITAFQPNRSTSPSQPRPMA